MRVFVAPNGKEITAANDAQASAFASSGFEEITIPFADEFEEEFEEEKPKNKGGRPRKVVNNG